MKKHYYKKTSHLMMQMKKTCIIKNIALDDVDEKNMYYKNIALDDVDEKNMYYKNIELDDVVKKHVL